MANRHEIIRRELAELKEKFSKSAEHPHELGDIVKRYIWSELIETANHECSFYPPWFFVKHLELSLAEARKLYREGCRYTYYYTIEEIYEFAVRLGIYR